MLFRSYSSALMWLMREQQYLCAYCRRGFDDLELGTRPTRDHVVPRSKGGSSARRNLVAACHDCNCRKGSQSAEEFCEQFGGMSAYIARKVRQGQQNPPLKLALPTPKNDPTRQNPPHSKNAPLKRLFTPEDVRQWDEDRFNHKD